MSKELILLLLALSLALASCSTGPHEQIPAAGTVYTYQSSRIDTSQSPTVSLRVTKDSKNFSANISRRIEAVGFKILENSGSPDYYADVDYKTYFDVVHQTFVYFQIDLIDAKSGESKIRLRYVGGTYSSYGCNTALDMVFKQLSKVKNGTNGT